MEGQMMKHWICLASVLLIAAALPILSQNRTSSKQSPAGSESGQTAAKDSEHENNGEQKFKQNCSRCHSTPEGFSPRISGTVVRHMRVRASLSQRDEQDILHYLNP
jgi:cytochrome c5